MKLYNTMTRSVEELTPLSNNTIKMYTCGLTVYSQPHIGNWVGYIYWDVLQRTLQAEGYDVARVQNYTDVGHLVSDGDSGEDKMEKGARAEGKTAWEVADKYIKIAEREAYEQLGLMTPTLVRATACIDEQIAFVQELEKKGYTYVIDGEGVYFDTSKLDDYGKLARLDIKGLKEGARVEIAGKKNPTDFALWKFSPEDRKRDMEWISPWGKGFPGWHLECSVIARENLGDQIDIHCGGIDHIPVHHTNEIAQTEAVTRKPFSTFWVHNNHLKVDSGKMSKSLGNIYTLQDILDKGFSLDAFKMLVLSKNYFTEGNFTWEILESAQNRLKNWLQFSARHWQLPAAEKDISGQLLTTLSDNLNTPEALKQIDVYFDECEQAGQSARPETLKAIEALLGISLLTADITSAQKTMLKKRAEARAMKNWHESDKIRDELNNQGIGVNDNSNTQIWFRL